MKNTIKNIQQKTEKERIEWLFNNFSAGLNRYAIAQWQVEEDARWDLIYQTIYKVAVVLPTKEIADIKHIQSLLFRTFINLLKNYLRDKKRKLNGLEKVELKDENTSAVEDIENSISPQLKRLNEVLDTLEDWERILLLMRAQEVSYKTISNYVNKPEQQLKVYYSRLKKKVEQQLKMTKDEL